jgi:hypothetical protein
MPRAGPLLQTPACPLRAFQRHRLPNPLTILRGGNARWCRVGSALCIPRAPSVQRNSRAQSITCIPEPWYATWV